MRAVGEYFSPSLSPLTPPLALSGLGAKNGGYYTTNGDVCFKKPSQGVAVAAGILVLGLGAVAGRAMTPPGRSKGAYTAFGALASIFGPLGIGVLGVVSLAQRR